LRKKINEHKNYQAHKEAINILEIAKEGALKISCSGWKGRLLTLCIHVLPNLNTQSEQTLFQSTARVSRTAYYMAKITNLSQTLKV